MNNKITDFREMKTTRKGKKSLNFDLIKKIFEIKRKHRIRARQKDMSLFKLIIIVHLKP